MSPETVSGVASRLIEALSRLLSVRILAGGVTGSPITAWIGVASESLFP